MIGGIDVILPSRAGSKQAIMAALRLIRSFWPKAVIEEVTTGKKTELASDELLPETDCDIFIYRDWDTVEKWDELGAEPELANTMIHVIAREQEVTVVVDDVESGIIPDFISGLRSMLDYWLRAGFRGAA